MMSVRDSAAIRRYEHDIYGLANDRVSSSTAITLRGLQVLDTYLTHSAGPALTRMLPRIDRVFAELESGQPSMALVRAVVESVRAALADASRGSDGASARTIVRREIVRLRREIASARSEIARVALPLFGRRRSVLTLSRSSEVSGALRRAHRSGRLDRVFVAESGPSCEGRALVRYLRRAGIGAEPVPIVAIERAVREADMALVGSDTVESDGTVVSKVGTYLIALACADQGKPFYATATSAKFARAEPARRRAASRRQRGAPLVEGRPAPGMRAVGALFDRTPHGLVTGYVTERGVVGTTEYVAGRRRNELTSRPAPRSVRRPRREDRWAIGPRRARR